MPIDSHLSYLEKHALVPPLIEVKPKAGLGCVLVVSGSDPRGVQVTLDAIHSCTRPPVPVEVLIVFHIGEATTAVDKLGQLAAREVATEWIQLHAKTAFAYHILDLPDVAPKDFGEGLTRKLAFDEGMRRLHAAGNPSGLLIWLDAGVMPDFGYLKDLHTYFERNHRTTSCTVGFYTLTEAEELTLRYAMQGLRSMGHPHAHYHMASTVVVRGTAYEQSGGMNRRKAGADFHFLHKLTPLGLHDDCPAARLLYCFPMPGLKAQEKVYAPEAYLVLRRFVQSVFENWEMPAIEVVSLAEDVHPSIGLWMAVHNVYDRIVDIQASARHAATFRQRFFHWFSLLQVQHFMNFTHPTYFEAVPLKAASAAILGIQATTDAYELLTKMRTRDHDPYSNSL
jgi:hypothetical protein